MKRDEFVTKINSLKKYQKSVGDFSKALSSFGDGYIFLNIGEQMFNIIKEDIIKNTKIEEEIIEWWLFENVDKFFYLDQDKKISVQKAEELYDYYYNKN